jgi:hypothetical protein
MLSPAAKSSTGEHFAHAQLPVAKPDITWYSRAHETTRKGRRYEKGSRPTDIGSANAEPYTGTAFWNPSRATSCPAAANRSAANGESALSSRNLNRRRSKLVLPDRLCRVAQRLLDVLRLQVRIGVHDLLRAHPIGDHPDHSRDRDAQPADARTPPIGRGFTTGSRKSEARCGGPLVRRHIGVG